MKTALLRFSPFLHIKIERLPIVCTLFVLIGFLCCRGVLEVLFSKPLAMALQLAGTTGCLTLLLFNAKIALKKGQEWWVAASLSFCCIAIFSAVLTSVIHAFFSWQIYFVFSLYVLFACLVGVVASRSSLVWLPAPQILLGWGLLLAFVGYVQFVGFLPMPGASRWMGGFIRSPSLTGSFLHYPIIISIFAFTAIQWYQLTGKGLYLSAGILFALAPFAVVSRSGMFIVLFTLLLIWISSIRHGSPLALWLGILFTASLVGLFSAYCFYQETLIGKLAMRLFTTSQASAAGNSGRITAWKDALELWFSSNLLLGEYMGVVTNSSHHVFGGRSHVAESGVLQQLVNFGFIGLITYYFVLIMVFREIDPQHKTLRFLFIACLLQTFFYQSIEVVPFITLLALMPLISKSYAHRAKTKEPIHVPICQAGSLQYDNRPAFR